MKFPWPKTKNAILNDEIQFLRAQIAQLQNYVLMTAPRSFSGFQHGPGLPVEGEIPTAPGRKLFTSEIEEDVEFALQEGQITEDRAKEILRDALEDVELQFD